MRRPDVPWGAGGDEEPSNPNGRWLQPPLGRSPRKPQGAIRWGKPGGKACAIAGREVGARAAHSLSMKGVSGRESHDVSRRRGGSGLGGSRRIGETNAHREKARTGIERGSRQGRQRYGLAGEWAEENATTIPARSAEAMRSVVKRSHPRLGGRQPIGATTGESRMRWTGKEAGYGCSLFELWEAETRSDASLISLHGKPQGDSREWDLAGKKSSRRQRRPRD